jgi:RNA-directed DNA polymerase
MPGAESLSSGILRRQVNWVLDADIRGFFRFLKHRIADKRILRLVAKWLKVGIVEDGRRTRGVCGAPQGAVASH